jgi:hypothetical protein
MRTTRKVLATTMIPQKATQVSVDPSPYCMSVCEVCKNVGMLFRTVVFVWNS